MRAIWQHGAHNTDQLLLAAKHEPYKRACFLMKNIKRVFSQKSQEGGPLAEKRTRQKEPEKCI